MQLDPAATASASLWAKIGIGVQMLALIRILAEYFRLRPGLDDGVDRELLDHYVVGALLAAILASVSTGLFFFDRHVAAAVVSVSTVVALLAYKFVVMGPGEDRSSMPDGGRR